MKTIIGLEVKDVNILGNAKVPGPAHEVATAGAMDGAKEMIIAHNLVH